MSETNKPTYKNVWCKQVTITKIKMRVSGENKQILDKLYFVIDENNRISYNPSKTIIETSDLSGIEQEHIKEVRYTTSEFLTQYDWVKKLSDVIKKDGKAIITVSYVIMTKQTEEEEVSYSFLKDSQFETVYCEKVHSKSVLNEQELLKSKWEKRQMDKEQTV